MLGKLIKHEFRATWFPMAIIAAALLGVSGFSRLFLFLINTFVKEEAVCAIFSTLIYFVTILLVSCSAFAVLVFITIRFYSNLYSAEGYLTLMIPVPRWYHLFTKTLVSMIWYLGAIVFIGISLIILFSGAFEQTDGNIFFVFSELSDAMSEVFGYGTLFNIVTLITLFVQMLQSIMMIYCSISIGQLFKKYRVLGAILAYFGISAVIGTVDTVKGIISAVSQALLLESAGNNAIRIQEMLSMTANVTVVVNLAFVLLFTAAMYIATNYILKRAVNLQ